MVCGASGQTSAYQHHAMVAHYQNGDSTGLNQYSQKTLARMWKAQRSSWWMTAMLHTFPESLAHDQKRQETDLAYLFSSEKALGSLAENYEGWTFSALGQGLLPRLLGVGVVKTEAKARRNLKACMGFTLASLFHLTVSAPYVPC